MGRAKEGTRRNQHYCCRCYCPYYCTAAKFISVDILGTSKLINSTPAQPEISTMSEIGTKRGSCEVPKVPSIAETVATWSTLSNVLKLEIMNDLEADDDNLLRSADIE